MILGEWARRVWYLMHRRRFERELAEEMAAHREMMGERQQFGNALRLREESRDAWISRWLDEAFQDLRHGARTLWRTPTFTLAAVLILSFGIGLNLAFFQLLNVRVLRPPRVRNPETLVSFDRHSKTFRSNGIPYPATQFIRHHNSVLSAVLTSGGGGVVWGDDASDRLGALYVSANWFTELGYGAALGRVFVEGTDERPDAPSAVVVSHELWRTRLQGESDVVGRSVRINDRPATIIGVAAKGFPDLEQHDPQLWLLLHQIDRFNPGTDFKEAWGAHNTQLYARLRPGITPAAAKDALRATVGELARLRPAEFRPDETLEPYSGHDGFRGPRDHKELLTVALLIGSLTLVVLMVVCANLSNLILSHAIARLREFGVRAALGASRWRIVRQQLVENLLLASLGALGGLLLGYWCVRILAAQTSTPRYLDFAPDWRMATAACAIALFSTLLFGLIPAWMVSRRDLVAVVKEGGHQTSRGLARARFRLMLIASEVAGCCVLLIVAGLMVRGLQRLLMSDLGFEFEQVAVMDASPRQYGIRGEAARAYWDEVKRSIGVRPDVERLALASQAPLGESVSESMYNDASRLRVTNMHVEPSFFQLMRIPLLTGRTFQPSDDHRAVIISRRLAIEMYGTLDVLGKGFPKSKPDRTIIGMSADAPLIKVGATTVAEQYSPIDRDGYADVLLLARARGNPEALLTPMRAAARAADSRILARAGLMKTDFDERLRTRRLASLVAGVIGLLALSLACFGIFGVVAYGVAMRTKEIGIRRALGADAASVVRLLLGQLAFPIGIGMLFGTVAGVAAGWMLARAPFYLPSTDVATPAVALVFFALTAIIAALVPASRALGTEPLQALRHE